jgi:hypothetical protein
MGKTQTECSLIGPVRAERHKRESVFVLLSPALQ